MYRAILISGRVNSGKTTFLHKKKSEYRESGFSVGGFTAEAVYEQGQKNGYDAKDLITGTREAIVRRDPTEDKQVRYYESGPKSSPSAARRPRTNILMGQGFQRVGPFKVLESGLDFCRRCVENAFHCDFISIDEVGPLEMSGGGHKPLLDKVLSEYTSTLIIVVRESVTDELIQNIEAKGWAVDVLSNW